MAHALHCDALQAAQVNERHSCEGGKSFFWLLDARLRVHDSFYCVPHRGGARNEIARNSNRSSRVLRYVNLPRVFLQHIKLCVQVVLIHAQG